MILEKKAQNINSIDKENDEIDNANDEIDNLNDEIGNANDEIKQIIAFYELNQ